MQNIRSVGTQLMAAAAVILAAGCGNSTDPTAASPAGPPPAGVKQASLDGMFVPVARPTPAASTRSARAAGNQDASADSQDFYLAIRRDTLGERWFLSAFMKQYFPGAVLGGAAVSLGTRVVSFKVQNGKLAVFDADDRRHQSDIFDPEILVESYPVVTGYAPFEYLPGSSDYVLIDPSAGMNRFALVGDDYTLGFAQLAIELTYLQNFRALDDGVQYEMVFTGYSGEPLTDDELDYNPFRVSGTMNVALRQYAESPGFDIKPMPATSHYFEGEPLQVKNTGELVRPAARWNIQPGMKPIKWMLSDSVARLAAEERFEGHDLVGAVAAGVENWNQAFGFDVFEVEVAAAGDSFADDAKNFIIVDPDPSVGFAFANWRTNPNTGEIRGASVYLGGTWFDPENHADDEGDEDDGDEDSRTAAPPRLVWNAMPHQPLCTYERPHHLAGANAALEGTNFEAYITHVVMHEIGHTLGLRHNFKGSLVPPTTSVMDYLNAADSYASVTPGSYDTDAVKWLYDLSADLPAQPFCTDGDLCRYGSVCDPMCAMFDTSADPLVTTHVDDLDFITMLRGLWGAGLSTTWVDWYTDGVLTFVRSGAQDEALRALAFLVEETTAAADADQANLDAADFVWRRAIMRTYLLPPFWPGRFGIETEAAPPVDVQVEAAFATELAATVTDAASVRSFETRRTAVDALVAMQSITGYRTLRAARMALATHLTTVTDADEQLYTEDLLARIDASLSPYFR